MMASWKVIFLSLNYLLPIYIQVCLAVVLDKHKVVKVFKAAKNRKAIGQWRRPFLEKEKAKGRSKDGFRFGKGISIIFCTLI